VKKIKRITVIVLFMAFLMALTIAAPVSACNRAKTTVVPCKFTMVGGPDYEPGKVWWTNDNTVLHVRGAAGSDLLFQGATAVPVQIGTSENTIVSLDFNTRTGEGFVIEICQMTFIAPINYYTGQPTGSPNPYGLGTLKGIIISRVTSLLGHGFMVPGDTEGHLLAMQGTGDFAKATLSAGLIGKPTLLPSPPYPPDMWDEFVYVGWDGVTPVATGTLTFRT
jgi:hypothetical protein